MFLNTKNGTAASSHRSDFFTNIRTGLGWLRNPYEVLERLQSRHGSSFWLDLPMFGRVFVTGNPGHIDSIRKQPALSGGLGMTFLRPILGDESVIMLHGTSHKLRRHQLAPLFNESALDRAEELTEKYARIAVDAAATNFTAYDLFKKINLNVITELLIPSENENGRTELTTAVEKFLGSFSNPAFLFIKPLQISCKGLSPWDRMQKNRSDLIRLIKKNLEGHPVFSQLDTNNAVQEIIALILFGHETAASAGSWFIYHLLSNPEVLSTLAGSPAPSKSWEAAVNESMRLCPVVVHLTRVATEDVVISDAGDGPHSTVNILKGQKVLPCTWLSQHDPLVFKDPESFRPDRFIRGERQYQNSFYPFGFGNRICIGKQLALRQMQIVAATLLARGNVSLLKRELRPQRNQVVIMPEGGCPLRKTND